MADVPLRTIVKELALQVRLLQSTVEGLRSNLSTIQNVNGSPEGVLDGRFAFDVQTNNFYINPDPTSNTGWLLIA